VHQLDFNKETFILRMHGANKKKLLTEVPFNEICTVKLKQRGHKTTAGTGDATQRGN
jgi:hypothetical protein